MNTVLKIILSMSLSGSLLILVLLLGKPLLGNGRSRRWQYYIWLVVIARLLLPFTPEASVVGTLFQQLEEPTAQTGTGFEPVGDAELAGKSELYSPAGQEDHLPMPDTLSIRNMAGASQYLWLVWLGGVLFLLIRKITVYQGFVKYIRAGRVEVSEIGFLDRLAQIEEQMGVKRPVELYTNHLIASPLLLGFFRPCIVLPSASLPDTDFEYTIRHELTHYQQRDLFYKWLVQATVCLHWFNPLVWLMGREISRACELACDEAVIRVLGPEERRAYGDTLLRAMGAGGSYENSLASVTLNESAELLKERLSAIMRFKRNSRWAAAVSLALTGALITGAAAAGAYPGPVGADTVPTVPYGTRTVQSTGVKSLAAQAERYYEAGSLPLFQIAFSRLDEEAQRKWLEQIYADNQIVFLSVAVRGLGEHSPLLADFAEKVYADGEMVFFSILTDCMEEAELELWLDRALEDGNWAFQSMLFNKLNRDDEFDEREKEREKEWEEARLAEYQSVGVTKNGKNYYYKGQLVNIFLDHRPNSSFYTLDMNPAGTVNVKIVRDQDGKITRAAYMTEAEVTELFGDMDDPDDEADVEMIPVDFKTIAAGETIFLGEYTFTDGDKIWYDISAKTGNRMKVFFARAEQENVVYWSVNNLRQPGESLRCAADFTVGPPATKPGTYRLYLQAPDGALGDVTGSIWLALADAS